MSKIHEALKKAQREETLAAQTRPEPAARRAETTPHTPNLDSLLAQMGPERWTPPYPRLLLFADGHDLPHLEAFRKLRSQLYLYARGRSLKVILLASAIPQEGKTFITANLGITLARQKEKRILLLDGDLRSGALSRFLGARKRPGLAELLKGEVGLVESIQRAPKDSLYLITAGEPTKQAAELLQGNALRLLLTQLRVTFDWILVDSPAAMPVSDIAPLTSIADGVLVITRAGVTDRDLVSRTAKMFSERLLGIVLNGVRRSDTYSPYEYPGYLSLSSP